MHPHWGHQGTLTPPSPELPPPFFHIVTANAAMLVKHKTQSAVRQKEEGACAEQQQAETPGLSRGREARFSTVTKSLDDKSTNIVLQK